MNTELRLSIRWALESQVTRHCQLPHAIHGVSFLSFLTLFSFLMSLLLLRRRPHSGSGKNVPVPAAWTKVSFFSGTILPRLQFQQVFPTQNGENCCYQKHFRS